MAEKLTPRIAPAMAMDFAPWWLHTVRENIVRNNHELRAGFPLSIEVKGPKQWQALNLPNNGIEFKTVEDRNTVLDWLTGAVELPPIPPPAKPAT